MSHSIEGVDTQKPLADLDHWEEFLKIRYPEGEKVQEDNNPQSKKQKSEFRDYRAEARPSVKEFYRLNHTHQTLDFVQQKKREYLPLRKKKMGVWEAMEF